MAPCNYHHYYHHQYFGEEKIKKLIGDKSDRRKSLGRIRYKNTFVFITFILHLHWRFIYCIRSLTIRMKITLFVNSNTFFRFFIFLKLKTSCWSKKSTKIVVLQKLNKSQSFQNWPYLSTVQQTYERTI